MLMMSQTSNTKILTMKEKEKNKGIFCSKEWTKVLTDKARHYVFAMLGQTFTEMLKNEYWAFFMNQAGGDKEGGKRLKTENGAR